MDISWTETYGKCPVCKKHDFLKTHSCPPSFEVMWDGDDEDDASTIYADDSEAAACRFVAQRWECESGPWKVKVRKTPDSEWEVFDVSVEMVPDFSAEKQS